MLVLDDVTPLIRAQKVAAWREVARRLAHEIKNPLTPIQLCAERLRRLFAGASPAAKALVDECTTTIVGEVESLKGLVDEFSQFARMPAPRTVPTDLAQLITDTLALYNGLFSEIGFEQRFADGVPLVRLDAEQVRRVIINLVDNAIEAMERRGRIVVETQLDRANSVARVIVADDGPGIPAAERDKLFLPCYSTKRRGRPRPRDRRRIIAEHGGSIDVADNAPHGTRLQSAAMLIDQGFPGYRLRATEGKRALDLGPEALSWAGVPPPGWRPCPQWLAYETDDPDRGRRPGVRSVGRRLERRGYEVEAVASGKPAWSA